MSIHPNETASLPPAYDPWAGVDRIRAENYRQIAGLMPTDTPSRPDYDAADPWVPPPALQAPVPVVAAPICSVEVLPSIIPVPPRNLDHEAVAAQFAAVAVSRAKLDRARSYAGRLGAHAAEIRTKLSAASERQVAAAIGTAEVDPADVGPVRGELVTVERQHAQALAILAEVGEEHARHESDLAALCGADGAARASLAELQTKRASVQTATDDAKALLSRAKAHGSAVSRKLDDARANEARHDAAAAARLRAALADGGEAPVTAEPFTRTSPGLEDDLRAAQTTVAQLAEDHARKRAALDEAERQVRGAVDAVMLAEADVVAREVMALDTRAILLRARLRSFTARPKGDYVVPPQGPPVRHPGGWVEMLPIPVPPRVMSSTEILSAIEGNPDARASVQDALRETAAWTAFAAALSADADAEVDFAIEAPPLPEPTPSPLPGGRFPASWETQPVPAAPAVAA